MRGGLGRLGATGALGLLVFVGCTAASTTPKSAPAPLPVVAPLSAAPSATPTSPALLAPGVHERQLEVDGLPRHWTTVVPTRAGGAAPAGLVIVLHGVGGSGAGMRTMDFEPLASASGMVMAYPDGFGAAWNDGRPGLDPVVPGVTVDDVRFLRLLIDETVAQTRADPRRVAVVGFSNGAIMATRVACDLSDQVAAVAVVAGSAGQGFQQSCRPAGPVGLMVVAGADDATVPYAGGKVASFGALNRGFVAPVEDLFSFWAAANGCASTATAVAGHVREARGVECRRASTVVRYQVGGAGHEWFRAPSFDTTGAVWDFVTRGFAATS